MSGGSRQKRVKLDDDKSIAHHVDSEDDFLELEEDDESYSSRVRKCLARKNNRYPPGMIPILDPNCDETGEASSSDLSIASLSDSDNDTTSSARQKNNKRNHNSKRKVSGKSPVRELSGTQSTVRDSLDVSEFWSSPKKTTETLRTLPADYITLDDSFTNTSREIVTLDDDSIAEGVGDEELDTELTVKVRFKGTIHRMNLKKTDFFRVLFEKISKLGCVPVNDISILHKEKALDPFDTLYKVPLSISDILEAYILQTGKDVESTFPNENTISLKVQTKDRKDVATLAIRKTDTMQVLMEKYSALKGLQVSKLKFVFDGEVLEPQETAESMDLEGDECIDVFHV